MAGGERTGVRTLIMDDLHFDPAMGTETLGEKRNPPVGVTGWAEPLTGEPLCGLSETAATCVPAWKMRLYCLIFYF